jgi:SAM-dependent methyltransferase
VDDWSLPREDLSRRNREGFRPPPHERAQTGIARIRAGMRRFADLQFGSIWHDLAALLPRVRGTLVDVGSGAQPFRDLIHADVRYIAVDIADAETQFGYRTPDTRYFDGSVLPVADKASDAVLCTETLEHVPDTVPFVRELARILAPGGQLILTVPFAARWHFVPHDYWRFTPAALTKLLCAADFQDVRIYARGGALTVAAYKVLGYVLLLLAGHGHHGIAAMVWRLVGICLLPIAVMAVLLGNLGLRFPGSAEDTLGYTVLARKGAAA